MFKIKIIALVVFAFCCLNVRAQTADSSRSISLAEYEKAKTFSVKDLDKDTYVKFENAYILDRYENKKPYMITGDDGQRKRIDLYKLIAKQGMQPLGVVIFYTTETGKLYRAVLPGLNADAKIWEHYFTDIHAIDKEEKNFVLKLSYVLSKELSFQLYKAEGKPMAKEGAEYSTNICFPGDNEVELADGTTKLLKDIVPGDYVATVNPQTKQQTISQVKALTVHPEKNYAIDELMLIKTNEVETIAAYKVSMSSKILKATPNHPVSTRNGSKAISQVRQGDNILCLNEHTKTYEYYRVVYKKEYAGGNQPVYNIVANSGETFIMNSVMVMQKQAEEK